MDRPRISVLTASIPSRAVRLLDCMRSVQSQTLQPVEHCVKVDHARAGCAETLNGLLDSARGDWIALLADDDLFMPHHLETLAEHADDADIIYSDCKVKGRDGWQPGGPFNPDRLRAGNYIPSTSLIRTRVADQIGGWKHDAQHGWEDWRFWLDAIETGARFKHVPAVTWIYDLSHGGNATWVGMHNAR